MAVLVRLIDTEKFEALLDKRRMTRKELAKMTGLSTTFVNYLANGQRNPSRATVELIAAALRVSPRRFVTEQWVPHGRTSSRPDPPSSSASA